jgi:hypothetical protein
MGCRWRERGSTTPCTAATCDWLMQVSTNGISMSAGCDWLMEVLTNGVSMARAWMYNPLHRSHM